MTQSLVERYNMHPADIEVRSFEIVEQLVPAHRLPADPAERGLFKRLIHAAGDPGLAEVIRISPGAVDAGVTALLSGAPVFTDVKMISVGTNGEMLRTVGSTVTCMMDDPRVPDLAKSQQLTRAIAAVRLHADRLSGAVVAIGNAPTGLLALLDLVDAGVCRPALIIGTAVGFVNAAESKEELTRRDIPYVTILGCRGGSPQAAAAINALLKVATGQGEPGAHYRNR